MKKNKNSDTMVPAQEVYNALIKGKGNDIDFFQVVKEVATGHIRLDTNSEKLRSVKDTVKFLKKIIKQIKTLDADSSK